MIAQVAASPASMIGTSLACTRASGMRASALLSRSESVPSVI